MCAYKLCRAEFRYWGMQSRCERFIHEIGTCISNDGCSEDPALAAHS